MLDVKYLRENLEAVEERLRTRGGAVSLAGFKECDNQRRELLQEGEKLKALRNSVSEEISRIKDKSLAQDRIVEMREVSRQIKVIDEKLREVEEVLQGCLLTIPNLPHQTTPVGNSEADNVEIRKWGKIPQFEFSPKPHWEIGEALESWTSNVALV